MRSGKPLPKDLRQTNINTLEKEFIYCIALTLAVRCPGVAHKVFSTVHRFITFNGLFMAKGFRPKRNKGHHSKPQATNDGPGLPQSKQKRNKMGIKEAAKVKGQKVFKNKGKAVEKEQIVGLCS